MMMVGSDVEAQRGQGEAPRNEAEARRWVRAYWARMIRHAEISAVPDLDSEMIESIWSSECARVAERLLKQNRGRS